MQAMMRIDHSPEVRTVGDEINFSLPLHASPFLTFHGRAHL
jgi:hypothetical protein